MTTKDYIKKIDIEKCSLYLRSDNIIVQRYPEFEEYEIGVNDLNELMDSMVILAENETVGILSVVGNYGTHSNEARGHDISRMDTFTKALAICFTKFTTKAVANTLLQVQTNEVSCENI